MQEKKACVTLSWWSERKYKLKTILPKLICRNSPSSSQRKQTRMGKSQFHDWVFVPTVSVMDHRFKEWNGCGWGTCLDPFLQHDARDLELPVKGVRPLRWMPAHLGPLRPQALQRLGAACFLLHLKGSDRFLLPTRWPALRSGNGLSDMEIGSG
jgi:hypothetical protein